MLTALSEPGYRDDMDKCNKDDSGGTGTRLYLLIFRNQIPSFLIFRNQILMADTPPPQHECNTTGMGSFSQNAAQASMKAFLEIQGNKVRGQFSPVTCPCLEVGWGYLGRFWGDKAKCSGCSWLWAQELGAHPAVMLLISGTPG